MGICCCKSNEIKEDYNIVIPEIPIEVPIVKEIVVQPIRFISYKNLKRLSSFPRYPQNADICYNEDQINRSDSLLVFFSHCWKGKPHPDNAKNEKFKLMIEAIEYLKRHAPGMKEIYVWIDYGCINQNTDSYEWKQLDKIIQACDLMLTVVVDDSNEKWEIPTSVVDVLDAYRAKAWTEGPYAYLNRCWCRLEMMYAANIPLYKDPIERIENFSLGLECASMDLRRPHFLYSTYDKERNGLPRVLPPLKNTFFENFDPLKGYITKNTDLVKIKDLIERLQPYIDENNRYGYVGERNTLGQPHGRGRFNYKNGSLYVGRWENGKKDGLGTFNYANGSTYVGEWKDHDIHGQGKMVYNNGDIYVGMFKSNKKDGSGIMSFVNGDVYEGEWVDNKKNGKGCYTSKHGNILKGTFKDDNCDGH